MDVKRVKKGESEEEGKERKRRNRRGNLMRLAMGDLVGEKTGEMEEGGKDEVEGLRNRRR